VQHSAIDITLEASPEDFIQALQSNEKITLQDETIRSIQKCRDYLDTQTSSMVNPIYGVNTGFGSLCNTIIPADELGQLQRNLLTSHACGAGEEVPSDIVRLMLLLKIRGLSYGHSGVQVQTVQRLLDFFNLGITPVVFQQGSLGASGDLAPLAHLCLPLIGEGEVYFKNKRMEASEALELAGLRAIELKSKEGLALINGTQFMLAYATWCIAKALHVSEMAASIAAMSLDAFDGRIEPFDENLHATRAHAGQQFFAKKMKSLLNGSSIISRKKEHVQDPYSFRCMPQVHGASIDAMKYVYGVVRTEINSVTDNPVVFAEQEKVISGGNFHGQPLALALDFLCIALAELGSISERRVYKLISGQRDLPPYLAKEPGLNSGFMIPQYTAASIVSQNKQLCTPASIDTIDSSNGQEDHVSMGANAATKCYRVLENLRSIYAIELFTAAQALDFRRPAKSSDPIEKLHSEVRKRVPFLEKDEQMSKHFQSLRSLL
jgi:histidine ammonia-lyase